MANHRILMAALLLSAGFFGGQLVIAADEETWDGTIVQYGKMHEAIGQKQHQGRVELKKLVGRPHFYGVGALKELTGEATIVDGNVTITRVDDNGQLKASEAKPVEESATLLVGAYVPAWTKHKVAKDVLPDDFDKYIADQAKSAGISVSDPFVFTVEGEFRDVRLHVINGACPLHARLKKIDLPKENQPFEAELEQVRGTIVAVYAKDAVGDITHPATATHMHLVFKEEKSGKMVTGHLEQVGLMEDAILRFPMVARDSEGADQKSVENEKPLPNSKVLLNNEYVKVTEITLSPFEELPKHRGQDRAIFSLSDYEVEYTENGKTVTKEWKHGDVHWHKAGDHALKILGEMQARFLVVARNKQQSLKTDPPKNVPELTKVAPESAKILLDNPQVQIVRVKLKAGQQIPTHRGWNRVVYPLTSYQARMTVEGKQEPIEKQLKEGDARWYPADSHSIMVTSKKDADTVIFAFKK